MMMMMQPNFLVVHNDPRKFHLCNSNTCGRKNILQHRLSNFISPSIDSIIISHEKNDEMISITSELICIAYSTLPISLHELCIARQSGEQVSDFPTQLNISLRWLIIG